MKLNIAINGFGRIGKAILRYSSRDDNINIIGINENKKIFKHL